MRKRERERVRVHTMDNENTTLGSVHPGMSEFYLLEATTIDFQFIMCGEVALIKNYVWMV